MEEVIPLEELIRDAEKFKELFNTKRKFEVLKFYGELSEASQKYIQDTAPYSICLRSAQHIF